MDKNTIIGFILIAAVLVGFGIYTQPSKEELQQQQTADSIAQVKKDNADKVARAEQLARKAQARKQILADTTALFHKALQGEAQNVVLQNNKVKLTFNSKGASVTEAVIKGYVGHNLQVNDGSKDSKDLTLFKGSDQMMNYTFMTKTANISTQDLYFTPSQVTDTSVTFIAQADSSKYIQLKYSLGKDYLLHLSISTVGMAGLFAPNSSQIYMDWKDMCRQQERGFNFENRYATLTYHFADGGTKYLSETKEETDKSIEDPIDWVAFKNQFFSAVVISKDNFAANALLTSVPKEKGSGYLKYYEAKMRTAFDPTGSNPTQLDFYYGPNDFRLLKKVEKESTFGKSLQMQRLVYLGWPLFRIINRWFTIYVFDWLSKIFPMGIVLILITLLLKVITYPMVKKSYMSSAKMRVLKPRLDEATKQYNNPEDQMQKQQAMMAEYAKYGVSPLSGCLPMLIQMPIWIAMFNFVPNAIELRGQSFLWIHDLSTYDPIIEWGKNIWLIGDHISLTCVLFCGANILYSWFTMQLQKDQMVGQQADQMKMMQWMMILMPVFFFFMFNDYSAGLNFYYFISLLFSAVIMWTLRHTTNDEKLLAILDARYKENKENPRKPTGFAARMMAMQQMQQEELKKQREELERKKRKL